jgi:DNA-binding transcriptional MerR regulator
MKIGELAEQAGMTVPAVRFYEQAGLLPKPERTSSGYRAYRDPDLRRLQLIQHAKSLGFSLAEVKRILRLREQGACPCEEVVSMLQRHLSNADDQIRRLRRFRNELAMTLASWKNAPDAAVVGEVICGLIERSMDHHELSQRIALRNDLSVGAGRRGSRETPATRRAAPKKERTRL